MTIPTAHGAAYAPNVSSKNAQRFRKNAHPNVWGKRPEALFGALLIEAGPDTQKTHTERAGFF